MPKIGIVMKMIMNVLFGVNIIFPCNFIDDGTVLFMDAQILYI